MKMKIIPNLIKDRKDEQLVNTTASLNQINPMIDRIMEDDSVVSVTLINDQGHPIITNIPVINATNLGQKIYPLGRFTRSAVKELDVFDEAMVMRINTKSYEIMLVPQEEFTVIVVQRSRVKSRRKATKKSRN